MDYYGFYTGREFEAYTYLGAHVTEEDVMFRTYAPKAAGVSLIGEFSVWKELPMKKIYDGQFYELNVPGAQHGQMYKYRIYHTDGKYIDHCDPYGFWAEVRPGTASRIYDMNRYRFGDAQWIRGARYRKNGPLNIYELHFGSWKKPGKEPDAWYRYEELAPLLIPYVKEPGYNAVEIMPLNEYPSDESWGYQATGFFCATSRYGEPDGLEEFIDACHRANIAVFLDVVTVHFALNDYALWNYDGTALYKYPNSDVGYSEWGSCNFMHSRGEVCSFLQSAADFRLKEYHFDGLRFDAVGNLIYWQGSAQRGENRGAIRFLQVVNEGLKSRFPYALLMAEDSTAFPNVTKPVLEGGLGFDYKWDMGWMNDTLRYFAAEPAQRPAMYGSLLFRMQYAYNEHYILPLSHDEVVHGKKTIVGRMPGTYEEKFAQARALYLYMYALPGKKLNFMGNEIGQLREWDEKREQDWDLLNYPMHRGFQRYMQDLSTIYLGHSALFEKDDDPAGFAWIVNGRKEDDAYAFVRISKKERILCVLNFSDRPQRLQLPTDKKRSLLIDSSAKIYEGVEENPEGTAPEKETDSRKVIEVVPFSGKMYLEK